MGDLPVSKITGEVAEAFRGRMRQLPPKRGVGIYAGMTPAQARTTAERLRTALSDPGEIIPWGKKSLSRKQADMYAVQLTMKTINKYFSVFTTWGAWMVAGDERSLLLHRGKCPFAGRRIRRAQLRRSRTRRAGRAPFTRPKTCALCSAAP